jgi:N-acetylmuramic acid 6-phosphate etherase
LLALEALGQPLSESGVRPHAVASGRASEERNALTGDLDLWPTATLVGVLHLLDGQAVAAVRPHLPAITAAADGIAARMAQGGRLVYAGAGTSGRLGVLDASECPPTFGIGPTRVVAAIAGGVAAVTGSVEGAEDDVSAGVTDMFKLAIGPLDSVVGIAASGRTPYVQGVLAEARRRGALAIALVGNWPTPLADTVDHLIAPLAGPEALTGSTRLKAGTAQKLVLNMLSTAVMVRLGKCYGNLMVDLRAENEKLRERARRIVAEACGISDQAAKEALLASGGEVKVAIVATLTGCSPADARQRLARAAGRVGQAVATIQTD